MQISYIYYIYIFIHTKTCGLENVTPLKYGNFSVAYRCSISGVVHGFTTHPDQSSVLPGLNFKTCLKVLRVDGNGKNLHIT